MKKAGVLAAFEKLSYAHRKEYCRWITEAKRKRPASRASQKQSRC